MLFVDGIYIPNQIILPQIYSDEYQWIKIG